MKKLIPLVALLAAAAVPAQSYQVGLSWSGASGTVGTVCETPSSCPAFAVDVSAGERVALDLRGAADGQFLLGTAASASQCVSIPNVFNALVLDFPIEIVLMGALPQGDSNAACAGGLLEISGVFPSGMAGVVIAIQAAVVDPQGRIVMTPAIVVSAI